MKSHIFSAINCYYSYWRFDFFDKELTIDGIDVKIKFLPDRTVVVFPGSKSALDYERDLMSIKEEQDLQLGGVGDGWLLGARDIYKELVPLIPVNLPVFFEGHSLGAARAFVQGALFIANGYNPKMINIITFGCPRPGAQKLIDIAKIAASCYCYRNGADSIDLNRSLDIVTTVPTEEMGGVLPPTVDIGSDPVSLDGWPLDLKWHHIQAYIVSMAVNN